MYAVANQDYEYILNKYHDTTQPFDPLKRFIRHDELFAAETGLDADALLQGIYENDRTYVHQLHALRKAHAFAFVLDHTRIACDPRDRYPSINAVDRPLNRTLINDWNQEVFVRTLPKIRQRMAKLESQGAVTIWPDYDHSVPEWDRVLALGFSGLLQNAHAAKERLRTQRALSAQEQAFFHSIDVTYAAIIRLLIRMANLASTSNNPRMAAALRAIAADKPKTFYEALLVLYVYFMLSEHIEGLQVRSLSNMDRLLFPFYSADLACGVADMSLREDLSYFLLQFTAIGNYWNQPLFLGGVKSDGTTEINSLSYTLLDVYDQMGIYNPKIQIKLSPSTPKPFVLKALDMIRRGHNCIVFVNDEVITAALMRKGATYDQARSCNIKGCYEYSLQGAFQTGMNYFNLMKPLEYTLYGGRDGLTGEMAGLQTPTEFDSFDAFYKAYMQQVYHLIDVCIDTVNAFEPYLALINPQPMLAATYSASLEKALDPLAGGSAENTTSLAFGFMANVVDSLTVIRRLVFENKQLSLSALGKILQNNFEGHELLRQQILHNGERFGNNKAYPDHLAKEIAASLAHYVRARPNSRNGSWDVSFHVARMSYSQGMTTAASADGRVLGDELSKNLSASMGSSRCGATAAILSTTKVDATAFAGDAPLDLGLHTSAVQGETGLEAMFTLVRTFAQRGGHAVHINVFSADMLRDAQQHPEKYPNLQIRVCGWNVLFNQIAPKEQDAFIRQAEALA